MKKTRLLEIIREEIAGALSEVSYAGPGAIPQLKKDPKYSKLSGDGKSNAEKELKSGGTVELEEDTLNEIPDFGGRYDQQVAAKYGEDQTLEDATKDITDEILADMGVTRDALKKDADMAANVLKAIRSKVVGKNQDPRVKKALEKQQEFDDSGNPLQANQTNNAILKALGLKEPGQRGRKASEKPETEKSPKVKAEKTTKSKDKPKPSTPTKKSEEDKALAAAEKTDKSLGGKYAKKLTPEEEDLFKTYKKQAVTLANKIEDAESASEKQKLTTQLKALRSNPEVAALFKAKGISI